MVFSVTQGKDAARILGRGGAQITQIRDSTGAMLKMHTPESSNEFLAGFGRDGQGKQVLVISGAAAQVANARCQVLQLVPCAERVK